MFKLTILLALIAVSQGGVIAPVVPVAHHVVAHPVAVAHPVVAHPVVAHRVVSHSAVLHPTVVHTAPVVPVVRHAPIIAVHH